MSVLAPCLWNPTQTNLPQSYVRYSSYEPAVSRAIIATTRAEVQEALRLIGDESVGTVADFDLEEYVYCFYFCGAVPERQGVGEATCLLPEVFGVERDYLRRTDVTYDSITFQLVVQDIRPTAPMPAHSPAIVYGIAKSSLDTQYNGTPPITEHTRYRAVEHRVAVHYHDKPAH